MLDDVLLSAIRVLVEGGDAVVAGLNTLVDRVRPNVLSHLYWYLGRSSGFIAYGLLFASVALGIAVSSRVADGLLARAWVFEVHRFLSVLVLIVMLFHALIMLPDPYAQFALKEVLVPFQSHIADTAMGIGILTFYGTVIITLSFYLTRFIGQKTWRALHYLTFALFVSATTHGVWSGTDSNLYAVQITYLSAGIGVMFLLFYRTLAMRSAKAKAKRASAPPRPAAAVAPMVPAQGE